MSRVPAYDAALEDAVMEFKQWDRVPHTAEEERALIPAIRQRMPDLERIVMTNRARHALENSRGGIYSPTFDRVYREAQRRTH